MLITARRLEVEVSLGEDARMLKNMSEMSKDSSHIHHQICHFPIVIPYVQYFANTQLAMTVKIVRFWDLQNNAEHCRFIQPEELKEIAFSPDGLTFAVSANTVD